MIIKLAQEHKNIVEAFLMLKIPRSFYHNADDLIILNSEIAGVATTLLSGKYPNEIPEYWITQDENDKFIELIKLEDKQLKLEIEIYYYILLSTIKIFEIYFKNDN